MGREFGSMNALLDEHESSLLTYAQIVTGGDIPLARDLLEHVLVAVYSRRRKPIAVDDAERLVRRIIATTYLARDRRRQRRLAVRQLLRPHDWIPRVTPPETHDAFLEILHELGPRERVCLIRYVLDGRKIEEIAREITVPSERVRACLRDTFDLIESRLGPIGDIDLDTIPVLGRGAG